MIRFKERIEQILGTYVYAEIIKKCIFNYVLVILENQLNGRIFNQIFIGFGA